MHEYFFTNIHLYFNFVISNQHYKIHINNNKRLANIIREFILMKSGDQKFSIQVKSTIKWVATGLALFGIVYLARKTYYKFVKQKQPKRKPQTQHQRKTQSKQNEGFNSLKTEYSEFYFDKDMQIQFIESSMPDRPTVQDIYLNSPFIARDQFIKYTREMRKRRRLVRKINQDQYANTILTYENQVQQLLFRSRMELVQSLNMDPDNFASMEENYQTIEDLRALHLKSQQNLRKKLITNTPQKKMSDQKLKQIIQEQLCFVHNKMYDRIRNKLQEEMKINQQQILMVIQALLEDIIYQKFGYETEDIVRKIQEINYNTKQRDEARNKMSIDIGDVNCDSLQSLQDPSQIPLIYESEQLKESANTLYKSQQEQSEEI